MLAHALPCSRFTPISQGVVMRGAVRHGRTAGCAHSLNEGFLGGQVSQLQLRKGQASLDEVHMRIRETLHTSESAALHGPMLQWHLEVEVEPHTHSFRSSLTGSNSMCREISQLHVLLQWA